MKSFASFFSIMLITVSFTISLIGCGGAKPTLINTPLNNPLTDLRTSIIHGDPVSADDTAIWKSTVKLSVRYPREISTCTGSILRSDIIVSAAHCVTDNPLAARIHFFKSSSEEVATRDATLYVVHANFEMSQTNDIALLRFKGGLPEGFEPAQLLGDLSQLKVDNAALIAGFGVTDGVHRTGDGLLNRTELTISEGPSPLNDLIILSDRSGNARSGCFGDSGGPAFAQVDGQLLLWGVAHAVNSMTCSLDTAYTNILANTGWILEKLKELGEIAAKEGR